MSDKITIPKLFMVPVWDLNPNEKNVKEHTKEQLHDLQKLIKLVGFKDPIVIDKDKTIWAGHGRLVAAQQLGMVDVPCIYVDDLTEDQKKAFMLMDNKINESPWIEANVKLVFDEVDPLVFEDFEMNFDDLEIDEPIVEESGDTPEIPETPMAKLGDIYQLGNHKLMCGDALTDLANFTANIRPKILYTDPPYGLGGYAGRSGKFSAIKGDDEDVTKFYQSLPKNIPERYIWGNWGNITSIDETPRDVIMWKKNNFGMGKGYRGQYEICMYFGSFAGSDSDVWEVKKDFVTEYKHPTQKPTELARRAILNSSKENDIVLDCYLGSGSTLIACEQTNRVCYGMEIEPGYIDVIIKRWENHTGRKAELVSNIK